MAFPQWSSQFSLENAQVDEEHQKLLHLLGWLEVELRGDRDMNADSVNATVHELNRHVEDHFHHEEALMDGLAAMPEAERQAHRQDHAQWKIRIKEHLPYLLRAATDLERRAHLARILLVGKAFWKEHFEVFDRRVGEFQSKGK
jgi:hemerythrin